MSAGELEGLGQQRGVEPHAHRGLVVAFGERDRALDDDPVAHALEHGERLAERGVALLQQPAREPILARQRVIRQPQLHAPRGDLFVEPPPARAHQLELDDEIERHAVRHRLGEPAG
ncbi:MAG: hypothetical protein RML56_03625 [Burkholderiales bacterium]|nr:hypothetical protein [Burkholderiales bacterium]